MASQLSSEGSPIADMDDSIDATRLRMIKNASTWSMDACAKSFMRFTSIGLIISLLRVLPLVLATNTKAVCLYLFAKLEEDLPKTMVQRRVNRNNRLRIHDEVIHSH
jgi:hypothetical protein